MPCLSVTRLLTRLSLLEKNWRIKMSTRANIVLKDESGKLIFYRHSDGYPEGTMPILEKFLNRVKSGELRNNIMQSAGHLIQMGRDEMLECFKNEIPAYYSWKVGFIEPTTSIHGDVEYIYTIDLDKNTIKVKAA